MNKPIISITEILDALRSAHEDAQEMMKPHAAADDLPFDVLPDILSEHYKTLVQALICFERDIAAVYAYAHGLPPLELEIIKRHADTDEKNEAKELSNQLTDFIYEFAAVTTNE